MNKYRADFKPFTTRMEAEGLPAVFIDTFAGYYDQLVAGETGLVRESAIEPVDTLTDADTLAAELTAVGTEALAKTTIIKLNGGLGTSMGLQKAKSLLSVRDGLSFLDIIARNAIAVQTPLLLMNSFVTDADSLAALEQYDALVGDLPRSFVQHKEPKVTQSDFSPAEWPQNPQLEWCPPGHGDIYTALISSGMLAALLDAGYEYAFVSNADNLGAVIDKKILGYFVNGRFPFMMEVADRTAMDKKGGHLARHADGHLLLRESAQCHDDDVGAFQDINRHRYFNTNNLWIHLPTLQKVMDEQDNQLGLPLLRNAKTVDPRDADSTAVYQIETAMGSAIAVFAGATALRVPRSRFAPVKETNDLLAVRSDAYELTDDYRIVSRTDKLVVELDDDVYRLVDELNGRFPHGSPSLIDCTSLRIKGDVAFGRDVVCRGDVMLHNQGSGQAIVPDGTVLEGTITYS